MTTINEEELFNFIDEALLHIKSGKNESSLRHVLSIHLSSIFPEKPHWINEWARKTETSANFDLNNTTRRGSIDNVVGKTAIEIEKNLNDRTLFNEGYGQVKEYCASLINEGHSIEEIRGVLSDTIHWYGYKVKETSTPSKGHLYGPDNLDLVLVGEIDLSEKDPLSVVQFSQFITEFIDRDGLFMLSADKICIDFGLNSEIYNSNIENIQDIVYSFFSSNSSSSKIVKQLWNQFVDYLGGSSEFDEVSYSNELYLSIFVKLLCANILERRPLISSDRELLDIINGNYFREKGIDNFIEYDYFGWTTSKEYSDFFVPLYKAFQNSMKCYDFESIETEDFLGPIFSNIVSNDHRILLGQEYTPVWLAEMITKRVIDSIPRNNSPRLLDMCCGTGVFLICALKETIKRYNFTPNCINQEQLYKLIYCVTGFDIDPLSVLMAKTNWIVCLRDYIPYLTHIVIPIYHADSLFSRTIISQNLKFNYKNDEITMDLDGEKVIIPGILISNEMRNLFDSLMEAAHQYADLLSKQNKQTPDLNNCIIIVHNSIKDLGITYHGDESQLIKCIFNLVSTFAKLQIEKRNGIWSFVISNSYRPGLVDGAFNGIISNPPWLSISKISRNPLGKKIKEYFAYFDITPSQESMLHMEISTVFLLNSVNKYLIPNSTIGCILPDSILNGKHLDSFRQGNYSTNSHPVKFRPVEIWDLDKNIFKTKSVVLFGIKDDWIPNPPISGLSCLSQSNSQPCKFHVETIGERIIWTSEKVKTCTVKPSYSPHQGADVMDRILFFYDISKQPNGKWSVKSIKRGNPSFVYITSKLKKWYNIDISVTNIDDEFVFDCYLSQHIHPFIILDPAKVILPVSNSNGWRALSQDELISQRSSLKFIIDSICIPETKLRSLEDIYSKLNTRNKLECQTFSDGEWLVVTGAGGKDVCASYLQLNGESSKKTVFDQTTYWISVNSEEEAIFITGILNSSKMSELIKPLQTKGNMGERHIHTTYIQFLPQFDIDNPLHMKIVMCTKKLIQEIHSNQNIVECGLLNINYSTLQIRRKKIKDIIKSLKCYDDYEQACNDLLSYSTYTK